MKLHSAPITVPMRYVRGIVKAAVARGASESQVLTWTEGLSPDMLDAPRARVSLKQFSRLYGVAVQYLQDEGAGLSACPIPLGSIETLIRAGSTANSFLECIEIISKALNAILHEVSVCFSADHEGINITFKETGELKGDRQSTYEVLLLTPYSTMGWLFGGRFKLVAVDFPCVAPRHLFELRTLFAGTLRFNQPHGVLRFSTEHAPMLVARSPGEISKYLRHAPSSMIEALITRGQLTVDVRKKIHDALPTLLLLNDVARSLALSPRSLHRKLGEEGESFQKIKDELRRDMAIHALTRTSTPLKYISTKLGFVDQASFQRAFVEWTGRPPGAWRRMSANRPSN
ncbi:MAG: AraC family transcriptional regulator ligand-binding domain-containing protein [Sulfuricaulis sp.]|nr:AraC family transcriptional regulator ligand-binding domain-containing protein [Sulfuricaulis sp.]